MSAKQDAIRELRLHADPQRAVLLQRFFKTAPGEYAHGDVLLGISVPTTRAVAKKYRGKLDLLAIEKLLQSKYHEERFLALILLVDFYDSDPQGTVTVYVNNITTAINNWDLVDVSAHKIVGRYFEDKPKDTLAQLAVSSSLWERRVAMIATYWYIRKRDCKTAIDIAELLVHDKHDLIQKAVGWMLREIGNRCSIKAERDFLDRHAKTMPRTMLRYAIEKFPTEIRKHYLHLKSYE